MSVTERSPEVAPEQNADALAPFPQTAAPEAAPRGRTKEAADRVRERRIGRAERRWWGRMAISLLIVWHLFALLIWLAPGNTAIGRLFLGPNGAVRQYLVTTAMAQSWNMFSPNPDKLDVYLEARVTLADGSVRPYFFPRMATMPYARRYREERWRKYIEVATHSVQPAVWAALARDAARHRDTDPNNRPVSVTLVRHAREIPPPGTPLPPYRTGPLFVGIGTYTLPIRPEDLN